MDERAAALSAWLRARGFVWEDKLDIVAEESGHGGGVWIRSQEALTVGDVVARIPKSACFTPKTCLPRTQALVEELVAFSKSTNNRRVRS